jgi:hypothetical protein
MFGFWAAKEPMPEPHDGLPDSHRPSGLCPRCIKQSSFETTGSLPVTFDGGRVVSTGKPTFDERASVFLCRHCRQGFVVVELEWAGGALKRHDPKAHGAIEWRGHHWWPVAGSTLHPSVPEPVRSTFEEASKCLAAQCPRAAAAMARCALEATVSDQGESSGALAARLQRLADKGTLQPMLAKWAKEVRLLGNDAVHDLTRSVLVEDARQLIDFIQELTKYLYVMPHDLDKRLSQQP